VDGSGWEGPIQWEGQAISSPHRACGCDREFVERGADQQYVRVWVKEGWRMWADVSGWEGQNEAQVNAVRGQGYTIRVRKVVFCLTF
jgi:hypothetical protein